MRVEDIIRFSAKLRKKDCSREAEALCQRLELDTDKKAEELSLGNRKKVSIVCALQHRPPLYILDEPTSGLDPLMQKEFFNLLEERNREGATIFLSSHVLSEIQKHCKNAAIIREGTLAAAGTVEELSKSSARRVHLHDACQVPNIPGIADVTKNGGQVSFLYSGDVKKLIAALNYVDFTDISIAEPDIEEMFMHYYEQGETR